MKHYFELTLIDNSVFSIYELWSKIYTQLHLALVELQNEQGIVPMGVSFPEYRYQPKVGGYLGSKLRIFAQSEVVLQQLDLTKWLSRLTDYVHCTSVREIPIDRVIGYAQYRRQHIKGSLEKLAKRRAKRHEISLDEAMKYQQNRVYTSDLPYIQLKSLTSQQLFRLCIQKRESEELVQEGFGTYGLSCSSTVPEF